MTSSVALPHTEKLPHLGIKALYHMSIHFQSWVYVPTVFHTFTVFYLFSFRNSF